MSRNGKSKQAGAIQALELAHRAFVILDDSLVPIYLSQQCARMLGVHPGSNPREHVNLFHELLSVARSRLRKKSTIAFGKGSANALRAVTLRSASGRNFDALAVPHEVTGEEWTVNEHPGATLLLIYDTSYVEAFLYMLEQSRRQRPLLIFASCITGTEGISPRSSSEAIMRSLLTDSEQPVSDLQREVSQAVHIADPLIPPSIKLGIDVKHSLLIDIPAIPFRRLLAHILIEAADFAGLNGHVRLRPRPTTPESRAAGSIELECVGVRHPIAYDSPDALDCYIIRRLTPDRHRITRRKTSQPDESGDDELEDMLSENGSLCARLAQEVDASISIKKPRENELLILATLPISTNALALGKVLREKDDQDNDNNGYKNGNAKKDK